MNAWRRARRSSSSCDCFRNYERLRCRLGGGSQSDSSVLVGWGGPLGGSRLAGLDSGLTAMRNATPLLEPVCSAVSGNSFSPLQQRTHCGSPLLEVRCWVERGGVVWPQAWVGPRHKMPLACTGVQHAHTACLTNTGHLPRSRRAAHAHPQTHFRRLDACMHPCTQPRSSNQAKQVL